MKFLIQHNLLSEGQLMDIKRGLDAYKLPHKFVGLIPFTQEIRTNKPLEGDAFIPYGSTSFIKTAQKEGWTGLCFNEATFDAAVWSAYRWDMMNKGNTMRVDEAIEFLKGPMTPRVKFLRPADDLKKFSGMVDTSENLRQFLMRALEAENTETGASISPSDMVLISKPMEIFAEYRFFIVGGRIVDGRRYKLRGDLLPGAVDKHTDHIARILASKWLPHRNCVMDLAHTENGLEVIEFNCINASGFYGHNVGVIFRELYYDLTDTHGSVS